MRNAGFTTKTKSIRINGKLVSRKPKLVGESDILNILKNPFPFGKFHYKNPDTGEQELYVSRDSYPVMIKDWRLFEKVQKVLEENNSRANGFKTNSFKFAKLLSCGFCGHTLTAEEMSRTYKDENCQNAKESIYYHCTSAKLHKDSSWYKDRFGADHSGVYASKKGKRKGQTINGCPQRWWKESELEEQVLEELSLIEYGDDVYDRLRTELNTEYQERADILEKKIRAAKLEQTKNQELLKNLVMAIAQERDDDIKENMRAEYKKIKAGQEEIKAEITLLEQSLELDTDEVLDSLRYCSNLKEKYLGLDIEGKKDLLSTVFSKIEPWRGEFRIKAKRGRKFGRKVKVDHVSFEWNEPWKTLQLINLQELIAEKEGYNVDLVGLRDNQPEVYYGTSEAEQEFNPTKKKELEASLFP
jgi:hypothetical protein